MTEFLVPLLFVSVFAFTLRRRVPLYDALTDGAMDGLKLMVRILPSLIVLLCAVSMLRACGILDMTAKWFAPVFRFVGIPPETAPLLLVRPLSGSAALAVGLELMKTYGPDSRIGLTTAVMLGSSETTFYTISVYFGAAGVKGTRHAVPAALLAELTGFVCAALSVRLFFPEG